MRLSAVAVRARLGDSSRAATALVVDTVPTHRLADLAIGLIHPDVIVVGSRRVPHPSRDVGWAGRTRAAWALADGIDATNPGTPVVRLVVPWPPELGPELAEAGIGEVVHLSSYLPESDEVVGVRARDDRGPGGGHLPARVGARGPALAARVRRPGRRRVLHRPVGLGQVDDRPRARRRARRRGAAAGHAARRRRGPPAPVARASGSTPSRARSTSTGSPGSRRSSPSTAASPSPHRSRRSTPAVATRGRWPNGHGAFLLVWVEHAARRVRGPRPQGPVRARPGGRGRGLHRDLVALRAARRRRRRDRHHRRRRAGGRAPDPRRARRRSWRRARRRTPVSATRL